MTRHLTVKNTIKMRVTSAMGYYALETMATNTNQAGLHGKSCRQKDFGQGYFAGDR